MLVPRISLFGYGFACVASAEAHAQSHMTKEVPMGFSENKLQQFSKKIISLPDQPNMQPTDLKAYFDSSPEEVRQAHNGLCDALSAATSAAALGFQRTAGVPADSVQNAIVNVQSQLCDAALGNVPFGSISGDRLAQDVQDRFTTIESAADTEASARASGDSQLQEQISNMQIVLSAKNQIISGYYIGNGAASRTISLGKTPRAVLVMTQSGEIYDSSSMALYGGLAVTGSPSFHIIYAMDAVTIALNGFTVYLGGTSNRVASNINGQRYHYIAVI